MRKLSWFVCIAWIVFISGNTVAGKTKTFQSPSYARHATVVDSGHSAISPDGKNIVSLLMLDENSDGFPSQVTAQTPDGILRGKINFGLDAEVLWSADSKAFSITGSSEGANGSTIPMLFMFRLIIWITYL